eukprot:TRINITY_DN48920_c0_g1_i1.p1 TRINITY_DN48920_c0_g1~~TRINITY_DN48920_c0_g1_i1.p1  ORF type:complete len:415 (+),score=47.09 TRINITY_DN48920_c0_g1_i1:63-1307(+)
MEFCTSLPPNQIFVQSHELARWEVVVDTCNKQDILKRGCVGFPVSPGFWTYSHDERAQSLQSDANSRTSSWSTVGPSVEDSGDTPNLYQNRDELAEVNACIESASWGENLVPDTLKFIKKLQNAGSNHGSVDLMQLLFDGSFVAVKRMPRAWTGSGFRQKREADCAKQGITSFCVASENPWLDVGLTKYLAKKGVPFVCQPLGVFFSASETLVVSQFATEGDLFEFVTQGPLPGDERERWLCPLFKQAFQAVLWLHDQHIAHCDISMENILVTKDTESCSLQVKLIDYGMASVGEKLIVGYRGKPAYQAPEMIANIYDPFRADVFSLGVVLYASASTSYPWMSTKPDTCKRFALAYNKGLCALIKRHKICRNGRTIRLMEAFSENISDVLHGFLAMYPRHRVTLRTAQAYEWLQ